MIEDTCPKSSHWPNMCWPRAKGSAFWLGTSPKHGPAFESKLAQINSPWALSNPIHRFNETPAALNRCARPERLVQGMFLSVTKAFPQTQNKKNNHNNTTTKNTTKSWVDFRKLIQTRGGCFISPGVNKVPPQFAEKAAQPLHKNSGTGFPNPKLISLVGSKNSKPRLASSNKKLRTPILFPALFPTTVGLRNCMRDPLQCMPARGEVFAVTSPGVWVFG